MKVAIYARVSDDKKKPDGERRQDIERQIEMGKEFWAGRGYLEKDIEVYADFGKSAYTEDFNQRTDFKRLLNDCRRHFIRQFWIEDMTRFSRNLSLGLQWLRELSQLNVNVISSKEGELEATSAGGWMKSSIFLLFAEWDSRIKAEKIRSGMQKAKNLGKRIGGRGKTPPSPIKIKKKEDLTGNSLNEENGIN